MKNDLLINKDSTRLSAEFNQLLNQAYRYLSHAPRSIYQMTEYLEKKSVDKPLISAVIDDLIEKKYLDDHQFAQSFVENRIRFKPKSGFALRFELKQKGISTSISEPILSCLDDFDLAKKSIQSKLNAWKAFDEKRMKKKVLNHLKYRGFSYDICIRVLNTIQTKEGEK